MTFRKLVNEPLSAPSAQWVAAIRKRFPNAAQAFRDDYGVDLQIALHFRDLHQHHFPIPVAVAEFIDPPVMIGEEPRFNEKWKYGVLLVERYPGDKLRMVEGERVHGALPEAVVPYPFFGVAYTTYMVSSGTYLPPYPKSFGCPMHLNQPVL